MVPELESLVNLSVRSLISGQAYCSCALLSPELTADVCAGSPAVQIAVSLFADDDHVLRECLKEQLPGVGQVLLVLACAQCDMQLSNYWAHDSLPWAT